MVVETLQDVLERGKTLPARPVAARDADDLALLIYTSGSTGAPKGAIYTQHLATKLWRPASWGWSDSVEPSIVLSFMPMSHVMGRSGLYGALSHGGTAYFAAKSDLSTFLDDLALVRPTHLSFVPRVWDMLSAEVHSEVDRRSSHGTDPVSDAEVISDVRTRLLGNRYLHGGHRVCSAVVRPQGVGRVVPGPAPGRRLRLDRSRRGLSRRAGAPPTGHRLQARRCA